MSRPGRHGRPAPRVTPPWAPVAAPRVTPVAVPRVAPVAVRRLAPVAVLLVALLAVPVVQADITVIDVRIEEFHDLQFGEADFDNACGDQSDIEVIAGGRGFRFFETDQGSGVPGGQQGYMASGCGTVTKRLPVPPGLQSVSLHFEADRIAQTFTLQADAALAQEVQLLDAQGNSVHGPHPVFPEEAPSQEMQEVGPITFLVDASRLGAFLDVQWMFSDEGLLLQGGATNPLSGQAFSARVQDVVVQLSRSVPATAYSTDSQESRQGTLQTVEHRVRVEVPPGFEPSSAPAISVRVPPGSDFHGVIVPDGTLLQDVSTQEGDALIGYGQTQSTLSLAPSYIEVTFPRILVQAHGAGEYVFVFRETSGVPVTPGLVPLAAVLLFAPLPFAALAWTESRAFRKEAFGRYAAAARNLQRGVVLVLSYYAIVVLSAAVGGRIALMAVWPMPLEGWLLHAQVVVAGIAFTGLWLVARQLFLIVRPPRGELEPIK